jgi:hypothetical protein
MLLIGGDIEWQPLNRGGKLVKDHGPDASILAGCLQQTVDQLVSGRAILPNGNLVQAYVVYQSHDANVRLTMCMAEWLGHLAIGTMYRLSSERRERNGQVYFSMQAGEMI